MTTLCVLVVRFLCASQAYAGAVHIMTIEPPSVRPRRSDATTSRRLGVEVDAIEADVLVRYPVTALDKNCRGSECVYYFKKCDTPAKKCAFVLGYSGDGRTVVADHLEIHYRDRKALAEAEKAIFIPSRAEGTSYIPLTEFLISTKPEPQPAHAFIAVTPQ